MLARCTTITKLEAEDVTSAKPMRSDISLIKKLEPETYNPSKIRYCIIIIIMNKRKKGHCFFYQAHI